MSGTQESDDLFDIEGVSGTIKDIVERNIGINSYQHNKVNRWTADIVDQILNDLTKANKPFKYIVQAVSRSHLSSSPSTYLPPLGDHAEEWSRSAYGQFVLLG